MKYFKALFISFSTLKEILLFSVCLFWVWLAINDESDNKSFSDLSDSDKLSDVTSTCTKNIMCA